MKTWPVTGQLLRKVSLSLLMLTLVIPRIIVVHCEPEVPQNVQIFVQNGQFQIEWEPIAIWDGDPLYYQSSCLIEHSNGRSEMGNERFIPWGTYPSRITIQHVNVTPESHFLCHFRAMNTAGDFSEWTRAVSSPLSLHQPTIVHHSDSENTDAQGNGSQRLQKSVGSIQKQTNLVNLPKIPAREKDPDSSFNWKDPDDEVNENGVDSNLLKASQAQNDRSTKCTGADIIERLSGHTIQGSNAILLDLRLRPEGLICLESDDIHVTLLDQHFVPRETRLIYRRWNTTETRHSISLVSSKNHDKQEERVIRLRLESGQLNENRIVQLTQLVIPLLDHRVAEPEPPSALTGRIREQFPTVHIVLICLCTALIALVLLLIVATFIYYRKQPSENNPKRNAKVDLSASGGQRESKLTASNGSLASDIINTTIPIHTGIPPHATFKLPPRSSSPKTVPNLITSFATPISSTTKNGNNISGFKDVRPMNAKILTGYETYYDKPQDLNAKMHL